MLVFYVQQDRLECDKNIDLWIGYSAEEHTVK